LAAGDTVISAGKADVKPGNTMPLRVMPVGTIIHNIELKPGKGGQLARSAGTYAQLVGRSEGYAQIRLKSGEMRMVHQTCLATVGAVSNPDHMNINLGKAGRKRWLGKRPQVRGVAMNPVDHPHGGGEGRTSGGRHSVWKGPFVDGYLLKKAAATKAEGRHKPIKTWSRRSTVMPSFVGLTFQVHNGRKFIPVVIDEDMVGHKLGEFAPTRTYYGFQVK